MGYIVEITDDKLSGLAENAEKMLRYGGKVMQCIDELSQDGHMGERGGYGRYGNRHDGGRYGNRYGMRDEDEWEDEDEYMGERRGRSYRTGRYVRR